MSTHRPRTGVDSDYLFVPKAKSPVLVCGLPGSGYVGKLGADQVVSVFQAKKVAEYRCDSFPPQVSVTEDGTAAPLKAELYLAKTGRAHDIFVLTADAQPATSEGEYQLSEEVVSYAKRHGVKNVYTLAAYITGSFSKESRVFAAGTSVELLGSMSKSGATLMKEGGITGMNGLIIGMAAVHGLAGGCLLGETSGYVLDAGASKAVLDVLSKLIDVPIDTTSLTEKAEETQRLISQLQTMADQSREATATPARETRPGYIS
jgi:uncharacterized protein (TIGR00162 family)